MRIRLPWVGRTVGVTGTQDSPRGSDLLDHHYMEERSLLKALEALFDPTTTARIVALPAAGEVVIAVEASPVSQNESRGAGTRRRVNLPETVTDMLIERSDDNG